MSDLPPPWSLKTQPRAVELSGKLVPFEDGVSVLLSMPGTTARYLPCFTRVEDLRALMESLGITGYRIKQIQDGAEFRSSIPSTTPEGHPLQIILDPSATERGTIRFTQLMGRD